MTGSDSSCKKTTYSSATTELCVVLASLPSPLQVWCYRSNHRRRCGEREWGREKKGGWRKKIELT
jgi:hypothetical protein